jgi:hypothetical protein
MKSIRMHAVPTTFIGKRTTLVRSFLDVPLMPDWIDILVELDERQQYASGYALPWEPTSAEDIILIAEGPTKRRRGRR